MVTAKIKNFNETIYKKLGIKKSSGDVNFSVVGLLLEELCSMLISIDENSLILFKRLEMEGGRELNSI
jgi:hypothetical protein